MIEYVNNDILAQQKEILEHLENSTGQVLHPADERRIFATAFLEYLVTRNELMDHQMKQRLLRFAEGENLDAIGETRACLRIGATKAKTILEFSVKEPKSFNITIPKGTRATNDGVRFFATTDLCMIQSGQTSVQAEAEATIEGSDHNGIHDGFITVLVDQIPNIDAVINLETTYGGSEIEDDEHYRSRIRGYPDAYSTAGPAKAYKQFALEANPDIADVLVITDQEILELDLPTYDQYAFFPEQNVLSLDCDGRITTTENEMIKIAVPGGAESVHVKITRSLAGKVIIIPIMNGGEIPSDDVLRQVYESCNRDDRRPLTDWIIVRKPEPVPYDIEIRYYTTKDVEGSVIENVEGEDGAIARYIKWQDEHLNQDINPDQLRKLILSAEFDEARNAPYRVEIIQPEYTKLTQSQVPKFSGNLKVTHEVSYG